MREPAIQLQIEQLRLNSGQEWCSQGNQWRFIFLQTGTAYWLDNLKPRELAHGELLIISPMVQGVIRASQLGEAQLYWFGFEPSSFLGFFSLMERAWLESQAIEAVGPVGWLPSTHPMAQEMAGLLNSHLAEAEVVERGKALVLALRVFAQVMPQTQSVLHRGAAAKERFDQIISHMPDTELIQRSSHELAQLCGCTTRHFNRLFRTRFGAPTRVRQTELRLLKARHLLENSKDTIAQIAAACGYRSSNLFNSLFRRHFGITPAEWRQNTQVR